MKNANEVLQALSYKLGMVAARYDQMADQRHSCTQSHLRTPWPPEKGCLGCEREIQKWVKRLYLEMPYRLFGWECVVDSAERAIQKRINQAQVHRDKGAGI